jgi:hypothetical protein
MKVEIEMQKKPDKDCKWVTVFEPIVKSPDHAIQSVYVSKKFTDGSVPIRITVETI